jgi:hypothetical protein
MVLGQRLREGPGQGGEETGSFLRAARSAEVGESLALSEAALACYCLDACVGHSIGVRAPLLPIRFSLPRVLMQQRCLWCKSGGLVVKIVFT